MAYSKGTAGPGPFEFTALSRTKHGCFRRRRNVGENHTPDHITLVCISPAFSFSRSNSLVLSNPLEDVAVFTRRFGLLLVLPGVAGVVFGRRRIVVMLGVLLAGGPGFLGGGVRKRCS